MRPVPTEACPEPIPGPSSEGETPPGCLGGVSYRSSGPEVSEAYPPTHSNILPASENLAG